MSTDYAWSNAGPYYTPVPCRWRSLKKIVEPTFEPLSLVEIKRHLRLEGCFTEDDSYIEALIVVAREYCETYCDMTIPLAKWRMRMDRFPGGMQLPKPPGYQDLTPDENGEIKDVAITYIGVNTCDPEVPLDPSKYQSDFQSIPAQIYTPCDNQGWPSSSYGPGSVTVEYWAGWPTREEIPAKLKHAMLMLVSHHYERRLAAECNTAETLFGVKALLDASKWGAYS